MRLGLVLLSLLPYAVAQAVTPSANANAASPTQHGNAPPPPGGTSPQAKVGPPAAVTSLNALEKQAAASTPNAPSAAATTRTSSSPNADAAQPTPAPAQTSPSFQFDMDSASVYTACQTQDIIWHYRPNPESKKITLYVYNEAAAEANAEAPLINQDPEPTGVLPTPTPGNGRRAVAERSEPDGLSKRQSEKRISRRIVKDWPANVAYSWVVDVPPGQYKFMAIVDGLGGDIAYPLEIVGSTNNTCVKDPSVPAAPGSSSSSPSSSASSAASSSSKGGAGVVGGLPQSSSAAPSPSASSGSRSAAAGSDGNNKGGGGISGGAIAGIVIGVLAGIALLALLAVCWRKKRRSKDASTYRVDPYDEPMREVRSRGFAPMSSSHDHETSSFGHAGDDVYGGMVVPPQRAAGAGAGAGVVGAVNPFDTEPSTPDERHGGTQSSHTPSSSVGHASVYTAPMSAESELEYPPPVGLLPVPASNRASAQSGTSTYESALTQAHSDSFATFGHGLGSQDRFGSQDRLGSHPSSRTLASSDSHFVPGADAPPVPAPVPASPPSPQRLPPALTSSTSLQRLPPAPTSPTSPQRLPPAPTSPTSPQRPPPAPTSPTSPQRLPPAPGPAPQRNITGGAPAPSAFAAGAAARGRSGSIGDTSSESGGATLERKISTRRKPVPQLSEEEAQLSPGGGPDAPRLLASGSSEGHDDWGSGLQDAINGVSQQRAYTLAADPPLHQD